MIRDWLEKLLDNPILVKHARSRLRRQALGSSIVVVLVICLCIIVGGVRLDGFHSGGVLGFLMALQLVLLGLMGSTQVGTSVGQARSSGILDFHRVSPLPPGQLVLGFFFGAPIREYLLFACTLPFLLICLALEAPGFRGMFQLMILEIASCWVLHGIVLVNSLLIKSQPGTRGIVGGLILMVIFSGTLISGLGRASLMVEREPRLSFFGVSLPWLPVVLIYLTAVLIFLFIAARRKMESERLHPLTKPQGIAAMAILSVLIVGGIWDSLDYSILLLPLLYVLTIVAIILTLMVTPSLAEYTKGLRRAGKQGIDRLPTWDDLALNRPFLAVLCGLMLLVSGLAWRPVQSSAPIDQVIQGHAFPLTVSNAILTVAYFGLAHQFFQLRFGRRGVTYFGLFLFLFWAVPLVGGTIWLASDRGNDVFAKTLYAISPIAGIGLTATEHQTNLAPHAAALTPSLLFVFLFQRLLSSAKHRVHGQVNATGERPGFAPEAKKTEAQGLDELVTSGG